MSIVSIRIPNLWVVIGLIGLFVDFIGAVLLAATATDSFTYWIRKLVEAEFTDEAKVSRDTLRSEGRITVDDPGFRYLNDVVSPYVNGDIRSYEWVETDVALGDEVKLELQSGETGKLTEIQISNAIDRFEQETIERLRIRINFLFGLILAVGFLMQMGSYVVRYFIV